MRSVEPVDFQNKAHRALIFDLALSNKEHLLNDYDNDIVVVIAGLEQRALSGWLHGFVAMVDHKMAGCFWVETDQYETGRVRAGLLPEYRNAWNGLYFLKWIVAYGFEILGLRKLDSEFPLYSKRDKEAAAAEKILKRIGFKKRTILPEALMVDGHPKDTILLDFLRRNYNVKTEAPGTPATT